MATLVSGGGSGQSDPINSPAAWDTINIAGTQTAVLTHGLLKHVKGFKRNNGWQRKKGRGSIGATLTYVQKPPIDGVLVFELWSTQQFQTWADFRSQFIYDATSGQTANEQAFSISHPSLDDIDLSSVVCEYITPAHHVGKGKYQIEIGLLEYLPTPKTSAVQTITLTNPNPKSTLPAAGYVPPTTLQKLKTAQAALFQQLQNSP